MSAGGSGGQGGSAWDPGVGGRVVPPSDTGGALSFGGVFSGGAMGVGGVVGTGGVARTGGTLGSGGIPRTGGTVGTGGLVRTGGVVGTGGKIVATGGRPSVGGDGAGVPGSGGLGRGGVSGGSSGTVTFANGRAEGAMTGYGWVGLGQLDTLSAPTCDGKLVTSSSTCSALEWPSSSALCISGGVPSISATGDYTANWGVMVAANVSEPSGAGLGQSFQSITFYLRGLPTTSIRGALHRKGDAEATNYCATIRSGVAVSLTSFNTYCWNGSGTPLTAADVPDLDWIGIQVYSGPDPITVSNLCLVSLVLK